MRTADYWDGRYVETAPDAQLHEWYRSYDQLDHFFTEAIFTSKPPETKPTILHLGSGDSVSLDNDTPSSQQAHVVSRQFRMTF